ncbi:hypothetical protein BDZ45DRAFT_674881 [Acephala macrosclerotiorum]|nr:hypothetical protein BDZ45DRAFT_674881 [Acephala macrosclerotiorum]
MSRLDSLIITTATQGSPSPPHDPHRALVRTRIGNRKVLVAPATRSNCQYLQDERRSSSRSLGPRKGPGSTGGSKHGRESSRSTKSSKRSSHHDVQRGLDSNKATVFKTEYSTINVRGNGVNINGSIGEPQTGRWSNIDAELRGGALLNGGIKNSTTEDVKVVEAILRHGSSSRNSSSEGNPDAGCCTIM